MPVGDPWPAVMDGPFTETKELLAGLGTVVAPATPARDRPADRAPPRGASVTILDRRRHVPPTAAVPAHRRAG
ncbi:MAG: hypothetical protein IT561_20295 [Alphaproteobacteria bacterium]|nr:hypothetical protein [Alphaproteobacteria bacterium]